MTARAITVGDMQEETCMLMCKVDVIQIQCVRRTLNEFALPHVCIIADALVYVACMYALY